MIAKGCCASCGAIARLGATGECGLCDGTAPEWNVSHGGELVGIYPGDTELDARGLALRDLHEDGEGEVGLQDLMATRYEKEVR